MTDEQLHAFDSGDVAYALQRLSAGGYDNAAQKGFLAAYKRLLNAEGAARYSDDSIKSARLSDWHVRGSWRLLLLKRDKPADYAVLVAEVEAAIDSGVAFLPEAPK